MRKAIILMALLIMLVGCSPQTCDEYINEFIEENNLSQDDVYTNGLGYWSVEKDGEQLTNCLGKGGKVNAYIPLS